MPKTFTQAIKELVETSGVRNDGDRLLAYLGMADAALNVATIDDLRRVQVVLIQHNSPFLPVIASALSRRAS